MRVNSQQEYYSELFKIQEQNAPSLAHLVLPASEKVYNIDLATRTIEAPNEFSIVSSDHASETIHFKIPRYYDNIDLTTTICIVQYTNAENESFIHPIPFYDVDSLSQVNYDVLIDDDNVAHKMVLEEPMIVIPWRVAGTAAAKAGKVTFAFQFYRFNGNSDMVYILNTLPQTLIIKQGLDVNPDDIKYTEESLVRQVYQEYFANAAQSAQEGSLYWEVSPFN